MPATLSEGQRQAVASLASIARHSGGDLLLDAGSQENVGTWLEMRVWLATGQIPGSAGGIDLNAREPVDILIPDDFPFRPPQAATGHSRFAGQPHVQWGRELCLYASAGDWDPSAGMADFLKRLLAFYEHVAAGTLGGPQAPWDPPVAYADARAGRVVITADLTPADRVRPGSFLRLAIGIQLGEGRADIVDWLDSGFDGDEPEELYRRLVRQLRDARARSGNDSAFLVPAVILPEPIAWEYPDSVMALLRAFMSAGTRPDDVILGLGFTMMVNRELRSAEGEAAGTYLLVRAPADKRFTTADPPAHFAAWRLAPEDETVLSLAGDPGYAAARARAWLKEAVISWATVYDDRKEAVLRRDTGRPAGRLQEASVLILGCGAIGAPVAEHCVRAGASTVRLVDWGTVHPGILVRQPYDYADIGLPKAKALAYRLSGIRPGTTAVAGAVADASQFLQANEKNLSTCNLIIDATADRSVAARIERLRRDNPRRWPDLVTIGISQTARYGVAAVTPRGSVGAGTDMLRRLGLAAVEESALADVYREFFPEERIEFEPERGCSGTTFIGSHTDVTALAAQMLDSALACTEPSVRVSAAGEAVYAPREKSLCVIRLGDGDDGKPARTRLVIPHDRIVADQSGTYQVRITPGAMEQMRCACAGDGSGSGTETGGLLLGQFDDACGVVWVSEAQGPPAGSIAGPEFIVVNSPEASGEVRERSRQTDGLIGFVGLWHTHPGGEARPSQVDLAAMAQLLEEAPGPSPRILVMILCFPGDAASASAAGDGSGEWEPDIYAEVLAG